MFQFEFHQDLTRISARYIALSAAVSRSDKVANGSIQKQGSPMCNIFGDRILRGGPAGLRTKKHIYYNPLHLLQQFLQVSHGRNSQARQHVLERLQEAFVPPHKEKVVVIWWCPAMVIIAQRANWCQKISCLSLPGNPISLQSRRHTK